MSFTDKELNAVKEIVEKYLPIHPMNEKGIGWYHIEGIIARLEAAEKVIEILNSGYGCKHGKTLEAIDAWLKSKGEARNDEP